MLGEREEQEKKTFLVLQTVTAGTSLRPPSLTLIPASELWNPEWKLFSSLMVTERLWHSSPFCDDDKEERKSTATKSQGWRTLFQLKAVASTTTWSSCLKMPISRLQSGILFFFVPRSGLKPYIWKKKKKKNPGILCPAKFRELTSGTNWNGWGGKMPKIFLELPGLYKCNWLIRWNDYILQMFSKRNNECRARKSMRRRERGREGVGCQGHISFCSLTRSPA